MSKVSKVVELRLAGCDYVECAELLAIPLDYVKKCCQLKGVTYKDIGDRSRHQNVKGTISTDWNKRVFDLTRGHFELIYDELLDNGEHRLGIKCTKCGAEKEISSISLRSGHGGIKCTPCQMERTRRRHEADKQIREWKKNYERGRVLVQMEMNFCECGRLLPFGVKRCEACRKELARQRERRKEHKRRIREGAEFDKTISLEKLYERDHGVCYICNKTCDWQDFQRVNGNFIVGGSYPTVEHVKALCHGGTHTWNNVKLACHACNSKKGKK